MKLKYKIAIPTCKGWTFIYLIGHSDKINSIEHYKADEDDAGDPETVILHGSGWSIEFEDSIDCERIIT